MQIQNIQSSNTAFGSTYSIPLKEWRMNAAKRARVKKYVSMWGPNVAYPKGNEGNVRVSIRERNDSRFEKGLRGIGIRIFRKFDRNNVPKTDGMMDEYISAETRKGNYLQIGKPKGAKPRINRYVERRAR